VTTLQAVELGVLGPLQVRQNGAPVAVPGAKPRAILTMLGLHDGSVVSADTLIELLWGEEPPRTAAKALQTHISSLRRTLGDGFVLTKGAGWTLAESQVDATRYKAAARRGRDAATAGDLGHAVARFEEALALWRGMPELPDGRRGTSEKTRWIEGHAALVEDRADALLATGRAAEVVGDLEAAVADAPLRERRWGQLMLALYRAGRQGEALGAYQRARSLLAEELGVDPGPELRRLEAAIVAQDASLEIPAAQNLPVVTRAVTFFLTDIEGSTAAWEADADAMGGALARHDELVEQVVTSRGGRLIKTRGEGDATFAVFERPSAAAAAAIELQDAITHEPWPLAEPMRVRVALHTGEAELRDGDYFGRAVNRAARLRSLAAGGQILCSGATAELVIDSLSDDVVLTDLGMRQLRNLARPEHVFELRLETADEHRQEASPEEPIERPSLPAVLAGPGPFVGRGSELGRLFSAWQTTLAGGTNAVLIAGEPGVGKTRLAGEWSRQAYDQDALVIYGRCDEDLGAPYQPFAEALRSLVPCLGSSGLRGLRGVEALLALVPGLTDVLPDLAAPTRADPDTERFALFDAVVALLGLASRGAPVVLILDDLHWAAKPTLLLLRHLLRFGENARVQIVGTYRSTDLDRSHPLAAMLADLHRDGTANRIALSGLDEKDVTAYVAEAGYDDEELARALASVTGGNPFFLIEALRHVEESGGHWDPSTLPQGVREAVSRRLSRLTPETNKALGAAAVVGSRFALELVERVVGDDLVDAFDEACKAGIVIEEPGGNYRFNHALVRQSLLAELASVRRMRLHQRIATTLETQPGADDELLAELAYHYFECAWAGNAAKAVDYCRRAADQAMARLGYEAAADLYDRALHALEEIDEELPDRDDQATELLIARCEALLAAGDVATAAGAVSQLQRATSDSARLAAWATCFDGELSMLINPERLDEIEAALGAAAAKLAELGDAAGEAKAHTVRASCLARLGRVGDCEVALDDALTAARRAGEHRRVNAVLAGAPLAALWGPNPVPRAGGRCLDVVRLLRITTDSPAVEATSTRCQAVLEAFRGRGAAARRMIDSARRTVTELGLRHALLEVEQFAGIVELVVDDPAAAEPHLRQAYNGFRRMGLDADTAETAALLGRTCLALDQETEADELCTESERLAGHALKPAIAWRMLRAQLLSRRSDHDEARRAAEAAVALAERTDALVDHGDACLALATVLSTAGNVDAARAAAERAVDLYERKGAAALAERAGHILGVQPVPPSPAPPEVPSVELDNACVRAAHQLVAAVNREAWDEVEQLIASTMAVESRRKIVGFGPVEFPSHNWPRLTRSYLELGIVRHVIDVIAVRGERLALVRLELDTADLSPGAPQDEALVVGGLDENGRIALQVWFDVDDVDAAIAELDAVHARFEEETHRQERRLENAAGQTGDRFVDLLAAGDWDGLAEILAQNFSLDDRRRLVGSGVSDGRDAQMANTRVMAELFTRNIARTRIATRGRNLILTRLGFSGRDEGPEAFLSELLVVVEIDDEGRMLAGVSFDLDDFDAAIAELDARYLAGEAAAHARTWSVIVRAYESLARRELSATTPNWVNLDHRRGIAFAPGDLIVYLREIWDEESVSSFIETVHRLNDLGAVFVQVSKGTSREGFDAERRVVNLLTVDGELIHRFEIFDEADLETAIAKFEQLSTPTPRLENAATRVVDDFLAYYAAGDWRAMAEVLAEDYSSDDRRRVVGSGVRHGRDAHLADMRARAELWLTNRTSTVIATRGQRLALTRTHMSDPNQGPEAFVTELLIVDEINADERLAAGVAFDVDDLEAAIAELDARYLAGEAAAHARTWSTITRGNAAANRRETLPITPDCTTIDHRLRATLGADDQNAYVRASWELTPDFHILIESVHRLSDLGVVVTHASRGTSQNGFDAEWRQITLLTVEGDLGNHCEIFDEADLDLALARFEELSKPVRLENTASRVCQRFESYLVAGDWGAAAETLADNIAQDDRRRLVGGGLRQGRDAIMAEISVVARELRSRTTDIIAVRGQNLVLNRVRSSFRDELPDAFGIDILDVIEIDSDERVLARIVFDLDDFDAAIAELDARYLAGEAAPYSHTWSVIVAGYAALSRYEPPATTPDFVSIDHRRAAAFAAGELIEYLRAGWDLGHDQKPYVEAVHRLSDLGAVVTHTAYGTSREGFYAEWREISLLTVDGDALSRAEVFDEADLDTATAKFDQFNQPARRLENTSSQVAERFLGYFAAGDWDAMASILADNVCNEDRRRVVGGEVRHGRDAQMADMQATAQLWTTSVTQTVLATRGTNLNLMCNGFSSRDDAAEKFVSEVYTVGEIDSDERIVSIVTFDLDDFDAASAELDRRYLSGEAAAHAHTWSIISGAYAAMNRHELFPTTLDWANIDHRKPGIIEEGGLNASLVSLWSLIPDVTFHVEAVHRLSDLGAVCAHVAHGVSRDGFNAEWRGIEVITVDGQLINRCEIFDDGDLDVALARFEELHPHASRLENAASRADDRFFAHTRARSWGAAAEVLADNTFVDDRRRVVNIGVWDGRDVVIANIRALAEAVAHVTSTVIAIRGEHLALTRICAPNRDLQQGDFGVEMLCIAELDADERIAAHLMFDLDDIDAATAELDARYLAGEAAAHAHTWSVITRGYAALNRRELPAATPDGVSIDHRRGGSFAPGELSTYIRAALDLTPEVRIYIEAVHRVTSLGAVVTEVAHGASLEGFDAEWRDVAMVTVDGGLISRGELFDEADLDAALTRFDELEMQPRRVENAASQVVEHFLAHFAARDWASIAETLADDFCNDDRRRVVGAGVRRGRDAEMADLRTIADVGLTKVTSTPVATRGERLVLTRGRLTSENQGADAYFTEPLIIVEIDANDRIVALVSFDLDDFDSAIEELDARYLAGEAAVHSQTWSVIAEAFAGYNRLELPATTPDPVYIDHRPLVSIEGTDLAASLRALLDLTSDVSVYIEAMHRLTELGAVTTQVVKGTWQEGADAEAWMIAMFTVERDLISGVEIFDEADLDAALARFDELHSQRRQLENSASRAHARLNACIAAGDWNAASETLADDIAIDDRRRVVNAGIQYGRDATIANLRGAIDLGLTNISPIVTATRGDRLELCRTCLRGQDGPDAFRMEFCSVHEIDADERIVARVVFDPDDIDAAFEELDARYLAGEAAVHSHTWSAITQAYAALNRRELPPTTPDWVNIDHRRAIAFAPGDMAAYIRVGRDVTPGTRLYIETVHRLSSLGVVVTQVMKGASEDGFEAEWREIGLIAFEGDRINRAELFDEEDLDAALARFDELDRPAYS
jgi:DNA-binding SARP family transcriptional activator